MLQLDRVKPGEGNIFVARIKKMQGYFYAGFLMTSLALLLLLLYGEQHQWIKYVLSIAGELQTDKAPDRVGAALDGPAIAGY